MNGILNEVVVVAELVARRLSEAERLVEVLKLKAKALVGLVKKDEGVVLVLNAHLWFAQRGKYLAEETFHRFSFKISVRISTWWWWVSSAESITPGSIFLSGSNLS